MSLRFNPSVVRRLEEERNGRPVYHHLSDKRQTICGREEQILSPVSSNLLAASFSLERRRREIEKNKSLRRTQYEEAMTRRRPGVYIHLRSQKHGRNLFPMRRQTDVREKVAQRRQRTVEREYLLLPLSRITDGRGKEEDDRRGKRTKDSKRRGERDQSDERTKKGKRRTTSLSRYYRRIQDREHSLVRFVYRPVYAHVWIYTADPSIFLSSLYTRQRRESIHQNCQRERKTERAEGERKKERKQLSPHPEEMPEGQFWKGRRKWMRREKREESSSGLNRLYIHLNVKERKKEKS